MIYNIAKTLPCTIVVSCLLIGCGGGGGEGSSSGGDSTGGSVAVPNTNMRVALTQLLSPSTIGTTWRSTSSAPSGYEAVVFTTSLSDQRYGKQGNLIGPNKVVKLQLNLSNAATTVLVGKFVYQIYIDKSTGGVVGAVGRYNDSNSLIPCINSTKQSQIPTSAQANDSGLMIDGLLDFFESGFRGGIYADYCQYVFPPAAASSQMKWAFEVEAKNSFVCIIDNIVNILRPTAKICFGVTQQGNITQSVKATVYDSKGEVLVEARN